MSETEIIPLFPLGLVLFPGMILPLHIFEERYKIMISDCLEEKKNFGIVYYTGDNFNMIGCTAKVIKIIKKYEDGRMDIMTEGSQRFHIVEMYEEKPYIEAKVTYFDDEYETGPEGLEAV